jgi:hypothetical protein
MPDAKLIQYINLKLAALGCPTCETGDNSQFEEMAALLAHQREDHPEIRTLFTRESMLASDWYANRLKARQKADIKLFDRHLRSLKAFAAKPNYAEEAQRLGVADRLKYAEKVLDLVRSADYPNQLRGTIGVQPL